MAFAVRRKIEPSENWGALFYDFLDTRLDKIEEEYSMEDIYKKIEDLSKNKFRRPIMMLALDGAHGPMRPEPSPHPRKGKRGGGRMERD